MSLWTPPQDRARQPAINAALLRSVNAVVEHMRYWNDKLKKIDADLQLVKARDNADAPGMRPGHFHVLRLRDDAPPLVHVIEGPDGEFREPDSGVLQDLARGDMWSDRSRAEHKRRVKAAKTEADRERGREREDRREELYDRLKTATTTSIFVK